MKWGWINGKLETGEVGRKVEHWYYYLHLDIQGTLGMTTWKGKMRSSSQRLWTWLHSSVFCCGAGRNKHENSCVLYILLKFFQTPRSTNFMKRTAKLASPIVLAVFQVNWPGEITGSVFPHFNTCTVWFCNFSLCLNWEVYWTMYALKNVSKKRIQKIIK